MARTKAELIRHPFRMNTPNTKVTQEAVWRIREAVGKVTNGQLSQELGLDRRYIQAIRQGKHYSYVPDRVITRLTVEQLVYLLCLHDRDDLVDLTTLNIDILDKDIFADYGKNIPVSRLRAAE